jgi:HAD superfamily phosphatase (TIGR01668 family)
MLQPDKYYESVYEIPYNDLWRDGTRALIFDLDNTLAPYKTAKPTPKVVALIRRLQRIGFSVCIVTNNTKRRMNAYNESLQLTAFHTALKPLPFALKRAMRAMGSDRSDTVIIGDQLFSDIWAGRNAGITSILVKPVSKKDVFTVWIKRFPERLFLNAYFKRLEAGTGA